MARRQGPASLENALPPARAKRIAKALLSWYDVKQRDLPWRRTDDPYAIMVSEFMLQQTQVATAMSYYRRFLAAMPDVHALAGAAEQEVLRLWAGLGYYSRARNLHAAARQIVDEHAGRVPDRFGDLLFLPGVGRYMAGAIASIAFGHAVPAVDANVARIVCRLQALAVNPAAARVRHSLEDLAQGMIPADRAGDFNQALMDLGATVCTAAAPRCPECPLRAMCHGAGQGAPERYPALPARRQTVEVHEVCALLRVEGRYLVARRPADRGRYRNMWEFPHVEVSAEADLGEALVAYLAEAFGIGVRPGDEWAQIRHQVTHHRITKHLLPCEAAGRLPALDIEKARLATLDEIGELPLGAPHKKICKLLVESAELFGI